MASFYDFKVRRLNVSVSKCPMRDFLAHRTACPKFEAPESDPVFQTRARYIYRGALQTNSPLRSVSKVHVLTFLPDPGNLNSCTRTYP